MLTLPPDCRNRYSDSFGPAQVVAGVLGVPILALGLRWLQVFVLTDYRAHLRSTFIPLGIAATLIGGSLLGFALSGWIRAKWRH